MCDSCGAEAGRVSVEPERHGATLERQAFTSVLTQRLGTDEAKAVRAALAAPTTRALFELDPEYAPWYCPGCDASYCGDHWARRDIFDEDDSGWHDSIRGTCPRGHERMLED